MTFHLIGGTTAISFSSTMLEVLWATANPDFTVDLSGNGNNVDVEFDSDDHHSEIAAWWDDGPQWMIRESEDNSDSDE